MGLSIQPTSIPIERQPVSFGEPKPESKFFTTRKLQEIYRDVGAITDDDKVGVVSELISSGHEVEGVNSEQSVFEGLKNIGGDVKELAKGLIGIIASPRQTFLGLSDVARGGFQRLAEKTMGTNFSPEVAESLVNPNLESGEVFDAVVNSIADMVGSKERLLETLERRPIQSALDLSLLFTGAGKGIQVGAKAAKTGSTLSRIMTEGGAGVVKIGEFIDPLVTGGKVAGWTKKKVSPLLRQQIVKTNKALGLDKLLERKSFEFGAKGAGISKATASNIAAKTRTSESAGKFVVEHGITGTIPEQARRFGKIADEATAVLDDGLLQITQKQRPSRSVKISLEESIDSLGGRKDIEAIELTKKLEELLVKHEGVVVDVPVKGFDIVTKTVLSKEGGVIKKDIKVPTKTTKKVKLKPEGLTVSEMNEVKRGLDSAIDIFTQTKGEVKSAKKAKELGNIRKSLRKEIEGIASRNGFKNVQGLNQEISIGKALKKNAEKIIIEAPSGAKSLGQDIIFQAGLVGSVIEKSFVFLTNVMGVVLGRRALTRPEFRTAMANLLYKMSNSDFKKFESGLKLGKITKDNKNIIGRFFRDMKKAFPEDIKFAKPIIGINRTIKNQQNQGATQ